MGSSRSMWSRMLRAAKLETDLYDEVEADGKATLQALAVVMVVILMTGVAWSIRIALEDGLAWAIWCLAFGVCLAVALWFLWSYITYLVATRFFHGPGRSTTYARMLRMVGFSNSPGIIGVGAAVPVLSWLLLPAAFVWVSVASVVAISRAFDFTTYRALATCVVGWLLYVIVLVGPLFLLAAIGRLR